MPPKPAVQAEPVKKLVTANLQSEAEKVETELAARDCERAREFLQRQLERVHQEAAPEHDEVVFVFPKKVSEGKDGTAAAVQTDDNKVEETCRIGCEVEISGQGVPNDGMRCTVVEWNQAQYKWMVRTPDGTSLAFARQFLNVLRTVEVRISCSRTLARRWSPAFEMHLRHGNGLSGSAPHEVRLGETTAEAFQALMAFMSSGRLPDAAIIASSEGSHPLLGLADRLGVVELKELYVEKLQKRTPLTVRSAPELLSLALSYNVPELEEKAAILLASQVTASTHAKMAFLKLAVAPAKRVLARDELQLPSGKELGAFQLMRDWVAKEPEQRAPLARELIQCVRFALLGLVELADLEEKVDSDEVLLPVATELTAAIRAACQEKLTVPRVSEKLVAGVAPVPTTTRKRKTTALETGKEEERLLKVMRLSNRLGISTSEGGA